MLLALYDQDSDISTLVLQLFFSTVKKCCAHKWFALVEITLFWREFQYIPNYAFFVLFFGSKIFICAILYAFSISDLTAVTGKPPKISIFHQKILFWSKFPVRGFLQKVRYFSKWFKKLPTTLTRYMFLSKKNLVWVCVLYISSARSEFGATCASSLSYFKGVLSLRSFFPEIRATPPPENPTSRRFTASSCLNLNQPISICENIWGLRIEDQGWGQFS